ncbi:MAG: ribonuclease P protein component [Candidatus Merdivicinus sp.]
MEEKNFPETLKLNKEFKRAYHQGKSLPTPYFVCYRVKNRKQGIRYGITTSKKVGNAVSRNRARRLIRAAFRSVWEKFDPNFDYVFVARERILDAKSYQVAAAMKGCIKNFRHSAEMPRKPQPDSRTPS